jgi:hypothetical protein
MKEIESGKNIAPVPETGKMSWIYQFFCWAGGGNIAVLKEMPTEQNRFFGYGTVIFMTAIFAMLSSAYAFSLLWHDQVGNFIIVPALAWAFFIFILDRFFIVSISNRGSFWRKLLMASPRLVLAVFIGVIISKPLEFRIFKNEINDELENIKGIETKRIDSLYRDQSLKLNNDKDTDIQKLFSAQKEIKPLEKQMTELKKEIYIKDSAINAREDSVTSEFKGIAKSGQKGIGKHYRFHENIVKRVLSEKEERDTLSKIVQRKLDSINTALQEEINKTILPKYAQMADSLGKAKNNRLSELQLNYEPSILNQQIALAKIQKDKDKPSAAITVWFITALFIIIEMAPMLLKLMTNAGSYENRIAQIEATYSTDNRLRRSLDMEEYKSNRELVRRLARSQRNIINNAMDEWHRDQLKKLKDDPEYFNNIFNENHDNNNNQ